MRLTVKIELEEPLVLPINYHHILQGIIYKNLAPFSVGAGGEMADRGVSYDVREFKLFTFSSLHGRYQIKDRKIIFRNEVSLEISSPDVFMIRKLKNNFQNYGISFGQNRITDLELTLSDHVIEKDVVPIRMISPVCVYTKGEEEDQPYYYAPEQEEFSKWIDDNFYRKYKMFYGVEPCGEVTIRPLKVSEKDNCITYYKKATISAWLGDYILSGERKYLDFLYQTGIGSKNSQGFGMWKEITE